VRLYVPVQVVDTTNGNARFNRSSITPEMIKKRVQAILKPFTFDYKICDWWTAYQIGQRIAPTFAKDDRIFLAGDAVHTHSPKVGLGMNMSMQDGFNIGWKVALVAAGVANPAILSTYNTERHRLAEMLLDFDRHWSGLFTENQPPEGGPGKTESMINVVEAFEDFADGLKAFYGASPLVCELDNEQGLIPGHHLVPGERFPPVKLRKQADGNTQWTTRTLESDGRFRLLILAGDIRDATQKQRVETLAGQLGAKNSLLSHYTAIPGRFESPVDVVTIHSAPWTETEFFDFPEILRGFDPNMGWGYGKIWCDDACIWDRNCDGKGYEKWGVDRMRGVMLVVRPDQYIGWVGELEDMDEMICYLDGALIRAVSGK
jgi:phenol 2-monooxygenase